MYSRTPTSTLATSYNGRTHVFSAAALSCHVDICFWSPAMDFVCRNFPKKQLPIDEMLLLNLNCSIQFLME
ncbi:hypothetical protein JG688_00011044 [Phytophthora aleatoria]|uniref:Uncharacterized protein n=1 Tax=Phytophthora aleatoria TaxID=2496075 RepID=A0A8J5IDB6_9STRA|nr:hypothetical protein JG688_00011044 [Phytophthora aleatoria]